MTFCLKASGWGFKILGFKDSWLQVSGLGAVSKLHVQGVVVSGRSRFTFSQRATEKNNVANFNSFGCGAYTVLPSLDYAGGRRRWRECRPIGDWVSDLPREGPLDGLMAQVDAGRDKLKTRLGVVCNTRNF